MFNNIKKKIEEKKRFKAALKHNKEHTFKSDAKFTEASWMCPFCNSVLTCYEWSPISGCQYKSCCRVPEGHRYYSFCASGRTIG